MPKKMFTMHVDVDDMLPQKPTLDENSFVPASAEEKEYMVQMRPSTTFFKDGVRRLKKNKVALVSFIIIVVLTLTSIILPMFWPYTYDQCLGDYDFYGSRDPSFNNLKPFEYSPTEKKWQEEGTFVMPHIMGTDDAGRDTFIRVIYGTRISLMGGFFASLIVLVMGMTIGSISGYLGGKVDIVIMRIVDIIYSLPDTLMVILLATTLGAALESVIRGTVLEDLGVNLISLFMVFALLYWVSMARLIRGQILSLREQEYVLAAKAAGAKSGWVIRKHLIPNCISVVIISTALQIPNAIFTESYLSFLGLGVNAPMPSLGSLAADARAAGNLVHNPWPLVFPAIAIGLVVLSLNLFGDGLRDAFDPKLKN